MTETLARPRVRSARRSDRVAAPASEAAIDFGRYVPTVLSRVVTRLRANANAFFQSTYGLSLLEWRVISALGAEGSMTAYAIWTEGGLDKAAVSRTLKSLKARGLVTIADGTTPGSRRRTAVSLTSAGRRLHAATLTTVIARHARLVDGIDPADLDAMLRTLAKIEAGIEAMAAETAVDPAIFPITKTRMG